ncbi:putative glutamine amidotransferase [Desulfohalotomaculum tongense]|uniref:gamma-glutamyl-gamma-aminobutyrate hydrolase family protein n=1 Tax=Desulforadius tongensis TaxID=1216062 RepID=UPI0019563F95|nr:gamma-glutamyl-gamma-aminobutyrate hydrolase family protein [Desulforadius tongensis]MBM7855360.1 putative glutamine amidotransferase [Desulforadius tongensis]
MSLPVIGITCCFDEDTGRVWLSKYYIEAVAAAGGVPLILPVLAPNYHVRRMLALCQGLLLPGGGDIDPLLFGEEPQPGSGEICPRCDHFELEIAQKALEEGMPILGICRGAQVLNVAAGGTVCQDITSEIKKPLKHSQQAPRWYPTHTVTVTAGSLLEKILGQKSIKVNSFHHQMVGKLGQNIKISALAPDGVIEAIEHESSNKFVLGVQYHPEVMWKNNSQAMAIFKALIKYANEFCK